MRNQVAVEDDEDEVLQRTFTTASQEGLRQDLGEYCEDEPRWLKERRDFVKATFCHMEKCIRDTPHVAAAVQKIKQRGRRFATFSTVLEEYFRDPPAGTNRWELKKDLRRVANWRNQIEHPDDPTPDVEGRYIAKDARACPDDGVSTEAIRALVNRLIEHFPMPKRKRPRNHSPQRADKDSSSSSSSSSSSLPGTPVRASSGSKVTAASEQLLYSPGGYMQSDDEDEYANYDLEAVEAALAARDSTTATTTISLGGYLNDGNDDLFAQIDVDSPSGSGNKRLRVSSSGAAV